MLLSVVKFFWGVMKRKIARVFLVPWVASLQLMVQEQRNREVSDACVYFLYAVRAGKYYRMPWNTNVMDPVATLNF